MTDVSVIIPCYNHGQYIDETINSVQNQTHQNFEIIVVNDGSTDEKTIEVLKRIKNPKIKVIHTSNQGLPSARNNGIKEAQSEIILPLDSDDKIAPTYIEEAFKIMKANYEVGIVYCQAELFGAKKGKWVLPEYSITKMLFNNVIFASSFFWRDDWVKANGYNANMKYGYEDWDFWLSILSMGKKVFQIPQFLFFYRIEKKSMIHLLSPQQKIEMHRQLFLNHQEFFRDHLSEFFKEIYRLQYLCNRSIFDKIINDILRHPIQTFKNQKHRFDITP